MNATDVECPLCGTLNEKLDLDETDGWMECEKCHNVVQVLKYVKSRRVPVYRMKDCQILVPLRQCHYPHVILAQRNSNRSCLSKPLS